MPDPRPFEDYSKEDNGKLKTAFEKSNPKYWNSIHRNTAATDKVKDIARDMDDKRQQLQNAYEDEFHDRVSLEAVKVWQERTEQYAYVAPHVGAHLMSNDSILSEARDRIAQQHEQELESLAEQETTQNEKIANILTHPKEIELMSDPTFKSDLHKIVEDAKTARIQVGKLMNTERERMLQEATDRGAQNPQKDVQNFQSLMYRNVEEKLHSDIHKLCQKHGYDADHKRVVFLSEASEEEMQNYSDLDQSHENIKNEEALEANSMPPIEDDQSQ